MPSPRMQITGERTVPGIPHENYWFRRHEVVYEYVLRLLPVESQVLEAGCGEGYGAELLRSHRHRSTALDYDAYATRHVRAAYPDIPVVRGNLVSLPFRAQAFDAVVSLQTVEHLWDQPAFISECRRVVRPGGPVILSTPNRLTFPPGNLFHTTELDPAGLRDLLARTGERPQLLGVHHGTRIADWEAAHGSIVDAQIGSDPREWPVRLAEFVASLRTADFMLQDDQLESSLDLVAITAG
ncbi:MAG: class I SAM-dependent methyltransferase [Nocardioidaceae bacterium]